MIQHKQNVSAVNQRPRACLSAPALRSVKDTLADVRGEDRRRSGWCWMVLDGAGWVGGGEFVGRRLPSALVLGTTA